VRLRRDIIGAVLAAFFATTAVPGPGVVAHTHTGGDHEHAHAFLGFELHHHDDEDEDDDDHDHDHDADHDDDHHHHAHHWTHHDDDDHALDLTEPDHDPLHHTHVFSPFQPATRAAPPLVVAALRVATRPTSPPTARLDRSLPSIRSRGPPTPSLV